MLKQLKTLALTGTLAVSSLVAGGQLAFAKEATKPLAVPTSKVSADESTPIGVGYCEMTIIQGVHSFDNKAQATGPCKGLENGYYNSYGNDFIITGGVTTVVEQDGAQYELASPQYSRLYLTVHIVRKGEQTTPTPSTPESPKESPKGWVKENDHWVFYNPSTAKKITGWLYDGSAWYYLASNGVMQTGWVKVNGKWYYLSGSGAMKTGWLYDNAWYYLASSGEMKTGWQWVNGKWYYLSGSGAMKTGWLYDRAWYYLASSGEMKTGWQFINGKWYYLYSNGKMAANTKIGKYYVDRNGAWVR